MDYSTCECGKPAYLTASKEEVQCLSCAVGIAAFLYCAGTLRGNRVALIRSVDHLNMLKRRFPWEKNIQDIYDKHVTRLDNDVAFQTEIVKRSPTFNSKMTNG